MNRMFLLFVLVLALLVGFSSNVLSSTYNFYHVAVRDYDGNGKFESKVTGEGNDVVRYGFTFTGGYPNTGNYTAVASNGAESQSKVFESTSSWSYKESYNGGAWTDQEYWAANFNINHITNVQLKDSGGVTIGDHTVNLPDLDTSFPSYNGYDPLTVSWQWETDGLRLSWDSITNPSPEQSSYRLTLDGNFDGINYSILNYLDGNTTNALISNEILNGMTDVGDLWNLQFQQRFRNTVDSADNLNWIRSYSAGYQCDFSQDASVLNQTSQVPIPGTILLLGSGLFGLAGLRRKHMS